MKIATTTEDFGFYCSSDEERIRELYRAGFRYIDLNMYSFTPECEYMQENWRSSVQRIKSLADELGMEFVQAHSQGGEIRSLKIRSTWIFWLKQLFVLLKFAKY